MDFEEEGIGEVLEALEEYGYLGCDEDFFVTEEGKEIIEKAVSVFRK